MTYNILSIRSPGDAREGLLYPEILNKGKSVKLYPKLDGDNVVQQLAVDVGVWEVQGDKYHQLGHFDGVQHTLLLTDSRLIVLTPNFKAGNKGDLLWGMDTLYVGSALLAKFQTYNRALTGHVWHWNVQRVAAKGTGSRSHPNQLRIFTIEQTTGENRNIFLQLALKMGTDPRPLAQSLIHRIANCWITSGRLPPQHLDDFQGLQEAPLLETTDDQWAQYVCPYLQVLRPPTNSDASEE